MKRLYTILMLAALTVISLPAAAQGARTMISNGDKALGSYNFELARNEYLRALERTQDTTERMVLMEKSPGAKTASACCSMPASPR